MRIAFSPTYRYTLPAKHRFPMDKYTLLPEQLLYEGTITEANFFAPNPLPEEAILRTHTADYWHKLKTNTLSVKEIRAIGFPMRPDLIARGRVIAQGTLDCARYAFQDGVALNIAGGTHHSFADRGEGFCVYNDIAIAAHELLHTGEIRKAIVIDLDVHQGNGTAKIFERDDRVFTLSFHGARNYPTRKMTSDLDVGFPDKTEDAAYLAKLEEVLPTLLDREQPDIVFYLSGVDILATDKLGRLACTIQGCKQRDKYVFEQCAQRGLPVAVSMGGGYSERLATIIEAHANTFRMAEGVFG
ncbi:acetoin utilization deacetylase AcuC-like enzyme [Lewinella antarctica]|uniref:Acetoin utilization deacetylase AcuC-like enzyme n=2 Tax=Neolewinella antarctica TaxID=442734 RepID=A0ABX0XAK1_9BACT|nr:histone deacetylase [Neolewinella antarctica]NJC26276.1 acetoin utilization deacetylase AcuC-like enzyme [Neolewinella antarctica]